MLKKTLLITPATIRISVVKNTHNKTLSVKPLIAAEVTAKENEKKKLYSSISPATFLSAPA